MGESRKRSVCHRVRLGNVPSVTEFVSPSSSSSTLLAFVGLDFGVHNTLTITIGGVAIRLPYPGSGYSVPGLLP
jgi:hypothetical protein